MVDYILGNYLVETGKITEEQLTETLDKQDSVRVKLGLIAVSEGMMTLEQTDEVNKLQAIMDQRFGDIAVSKGYLSDEQVGKLLKQQGNAYLMFVQTLVDNGYINMEDVDTIINDFRQARGYSHSEMEDIKSDEVDRIVPLFLPAEGKQYAEIISTAVRTFIRLIDRRVSIGNVVMVDAMPADNQVNQALAGNKGILDCFSEGCGALLKTATIFGQEEFEQIDMDSLDAAGEFLNCINGLYASSMSRQGEFLELLPPEYVDVTEKVKNICKVPIRIGNQCLFFTVAELV